MRRNAIFCHSEAIFHNPMQFKSQSPSRVQYTPENTSSSGSSGNRYTSNIRPSVGALQPSVLWMLRILCVGIPIGSMYGIYANIWSILMVNVTIYSIHGSYGIVLLTDIDWHCRRNICNISALHNLHSSSAFDVNLKREAGDIQQPCFQISIIFGIWSLSINAEKYPIRLRILQTQSQPGDSRR